jgi:chemotaxis protein CheX
MKATSPQRSQPGVSFDPSWHALLECAALEVFEMMAGARLEVRPASSEEPHGEQTAMVGLAGALCGMVTLRCSNASAIKLAAMMLGGDAASSAASARDALGELCNMAAGNFKAKITSLVNDCLLSVPTVISGEDYSMSTSEPSDSTTVALIFDGEPIWISLIVHN